MTRRLSKATKQGYLKRIRRDYPLEIKTRKLTKEEFEECRKLSHHIRKSQHFKKYCILDNAIAYHLGGLLHDEEDIELESILFNLNRLLTEKGATPTDEELMDYLEAHQLELKWHPEVVKLCVEEMVKNLGGVPGGN